MKERKTQIIIENEREVVKVPLGRSDKHCFIYKEEREFLRRLGLTMNWNVTPNGYVTACSSISPNAYVLVSRVLMDAAAGQSVRYRDRDKLNLRLNNLYITEDKLAIRRDRDFVGHKAIHLGKSL
jgi:hypothetical protein